MSLRVIFMGTPQFAVPTLEALIKAGHEIVAVYSQPPRPGGRRGLELTPSPVHNAAIAHGIEVRTPLDFKSEDEIAAFKALNADVAIVVAYGLLLPEAILGGTRYGAYNGHASALPRWRGAAPIQRAIMAGDSATAMMVMKMDRGLDTGPVAMAASIPIDADMTGGQLHDGLAQHGADLMVTAMARLEAGTLSLTPQPLEGVLYAAKITKAETRIDFNRPAEDVHNHIRALSPVPGAWFEARIAGRTERIKVLESKIAPRSGHGSGTPGDVLDNHLTIACQTGAIGLTRLQKAGGRPLDREEFLRGTPLLPGMRII